MHLLVSRQSTLIRYADTFDVMTEDDAPCYSNPDGIELEMGGDDE